MYSDGDGDGYLEIKAFHLIERFGKRQRCRLGRFFRGKALFFLLIVGLTETKASWPYLHAYFQCCLFLHVPCMPLSEERFVSFLYLFLYLFVKQILVGDFVVFTSNTAYSV